MPRLRDGRATTWRRRPAPSCATRASRASAIGVTRRAHLRYDGTDTALPVALGRAGRDDARRSRRAYRAHVLVPDGPAARRRGGLGRGRSGSREQPDLPRPAASSPATAAPRPAGDRSGCTRGGAWRDVAAATGASDLRAGRHGRPARRSSPRPTPPPSSTPAGRPRSTDARPPAARRAVAARADAPTVGTEVDPVLLEIFNNLFMSIAEQMGAALESTAQSVNIKERLDFSCALFDADGNLIANAPHIPVHLGSMGASDQGGDPPRGAGGCGPATCTRSTTRTTAAPTCPTSPSSPRSSTTGRASGRACSSSPPAATTPRSAGSPRLHARRQPRRRRGGRALRQLAARRGRPVPRGGDPRAARPRRRIPSRNPDTNLADLRAQIAANEKGVEELAQDDRPLRPRRRPGLHAARPGQRRGIGPPGHRRARRRRVPLRDGQRRASSRSASPSTAPAAARRSTSPAPRPSWPRNFNAPVVGGDRRACSTSSAPWSTTTSRSTTAACARCGSSSRTARCSRPPTRPRSSPATSRPPRRSPARCTPRCGVQAEGSGTMNNVTFGNERHQYYETVGLRLRRGRRLRRGVGGADAHDQLPADRPRGARVAVPGAAARSSRSGAAAAAPAGGAAATAPSAGSASSSR